MNGIVTFSLQSGSSGNSIYVEAGGVKLLFDAGIAGIAAMARLRAKGRDITEVDALIISHDHADHIRYAGVYRRKYGLPVYLTPKTLEAGLCRFPLLGPLEDARTFLAGSVLQFGPVSVRTVPTSHDGADGSAFVISFEGRNLGILTDLGHPFPGLGGLISRLDGVFIESNYDHRMLQAGPYPAFLKKRIQGPRGHLSNAEAAELLREHGARLKWACLSHLSGRNNHPEIALRTHRAMDGGHRLYVASREAASNIFRL
ncbi:MAG: MBL fold metallo-hydrolase [Nitrospiraceae bacterium]|nr:MBL fold metallo-hydrolase [Nitrospiraceae bacterium]